jgi:hypothetical protein
VTIPFPQRDVHFFAHTPLKVDGTPGSKATEKSGSHK